MAIRLVTQKFRVKRTSSDSVPILILLLTLAAVTYAAPEGALHTELVILLVMIPVVVIWVYITRQPTEATMDASRIVFTGPFGYRVAIALGDIEAVTVRHGSSSSVQIRGAWARVVLDLGLHAQQRQVVALLEALHETVARRAFDKESSSLVDRAQRAQSERMADIIDMRHYWLARALWILGYLLPVASLSTYGMFGTEAATVVVLVIGGLFVLTYACVLFLAFLEVRALGYRGPSMVVLLLVLGILVSVTMSRFGWLFR